MREDLAGGAALTSAPSASLRPPSLPAPAGPHDAGSELPLAYDADAGGLAYDAGAERLLHSDPHDFAGLYIRHRSSFTLHARRYLSDARDADEVVQEAFLRLFLALPELETELQALAYCRRTITNLCIDRYRAQARRPRLVDLESVGAEELAENDPGDPVVRAEDAAVVRDALSMLSPLHRAALVKREIEEKPLPVIAEELHIAEDSVKHVLFRARRALRRLLAATSLAPGGDAESARGPIAARAGSGGLAALILLVVLGLGSGPNLEAIPVVGADLPDLIGVTELAEAVSDAVDEAVTGVADAVGAVGAAVRPPDRSTGRGDVQQAPQAPDGSSAGSTPTTQPGDTGTAVQPEPGRGSAPSSGAAAGPQSPAAAGPEAATPRSAAADTPSSTTGGGTSQGQPTGEPRAEPGGTAGRDRSAEPVVQGPSTPSGPTGAGRAPVVPGTAGGPGVDGRVEVRAPAAADVPGRIMDRQDRTTGSDRGGSGAVDVRRAGSGADVATRPTEAAGTAPTAGPGKGRAAYKAGGKVKADKKDKTRLTDDRKSKVSLTAPVTDVSTVLDPLTGVTVSTVGS